MGLVPETELHEGRLPGFVVRFANTWTAGSHTGHDFDTTNGDNNNKDHHEPRDWDTLLETDIPRGR